MIDGLDVRRAVEVLASEGLDAYGSAYRISSRLFLTARHVVAGHHDLQVRFRGPTGTVKLPVRCRWTGSRADLALLETAEDAQPDDGVEPVQLGHLQAGSLASVPFQAIGYAAAKQRTDTGTLVRDTEPIRGDIPLAAFGKTGLLDLRADSVPLRRHDKWSGVSGAAVFADGCLVGVIKEAENGEPLVAWRIAVATGTYSPPMQEYAETEQSIAAFRDLLQRHGIAVDLRQIPSAASRMSQPYAGRLAQISALHTQLADRTGEVESLVAFMHGAERYLLLTGIAWAGKTALLAHMAVAPPADVTIVTFFISKRDQQNSLPDYLDAVCGQLAAVLGEYPPAQASINALHDLWVRAAESCVQKAKRLVLLVDGIDENADTGTEPSIASQLPADVPGHAHVLVAIREGVPIPLDVDGNHPLRRCRRLELTPSTAATQLKLRAEQELREHLVPGPSRAVLCAMAWASAPLTVPEIARFSQVEPAVVRTLLDSTLGRLVLTVDGDEPGPSNTLGHETLVAAIRETFDADTDARYTLVARSWFREQAALGWSQSTSPYLWRHYATRLHQDGDSSTLVELVLSPGRSAFLFRHTGGHAASVSEIRLALHLLDGRPEALGECAALALAATTLVNRSATVPLVWLPILVRLGDIDGALRIAANTADDRTRDDMNESIARALVGIGEHRLALDVALDIVETRERARVCCYLIEELDDRDRYVSRRALDEVRSVLESLEPFDFANCAVDIARSAELPAPDAQRVLTEASRQLGESHRGLSIKCLSSAYSLSVSHGDAEERSREILSDLLAKLGQLANSYLVSSREVQQACNDTSAALAAAPAANRSEFLHSVAESSSPLLVTGMVSALLDEGQAIAEEALTRAERAITATQGDDAPELYARLSLAWSTLDHDTGKRFLMRALSAARSLRGMANYSPASRLVHQSGSLLEAAAAIDPQAVRMVLDTLAEVVREESGNDDYFENLCKVGAACQSNGFADMARSIWRECLNVAHEMQDYEKRRSALNSIAHMAALDDHDLEGVFADALAEAVRVTNVTPRSRALHYVASSACYRLDPQRAPTLFQRLERAASDLADPRDRSLVLGIIAECTLETGDQQATRRILSAALEAGPAADDPAFHATTLVLQARAGLRSSQRKAALTWLSEADLLRQGALSVDDFFQRDSTWSLEVEIASLSARARVSADPLACLARVTKGISPHVMNSHENLGSLCAELITQCPSARARRQGYEILAMWYKGETTYSASPRPWLGWVPDAYDALSSRDLASLLRAIAAADAESGTYIAHVYVGLSRLLPGTSAEIDVLVAELLTQALAKARNRPYGQVDVLARALSVCARRLAVNGAARTAEPGLHLLAEIIDSRLGSWQMREVTSLDRISYAARAAHFVSDAQLWSKYRRRLEEAHSDLGKLTIPCLIQTALADPPATVPSINSLLRTVLQDGDGPVLAAVTWHVTELARGALDPVSHGDLLEQVLRCTADIDDAYRRATVVIDAASDLAALGRPSAAADALLGLLASLRTSTYAGVTLLGEVPGRVARVAARLGADEVVSAAAAASAEPYALSSLRRHPSDVLRYAVDSSPTVATTFLEAFASWAGFPLVDANRSERALFGHRPRITTIVKSVSSWSWPRHRDQ